ncbi:hypothetical protein Tco_1484648 [Tanacetum coccineum]
MDDQLTMEEFIRIKEEKARKRGKVFNWEIAKYGKIWYDEDVHNLNISVEFETEFPAIVFNDTLMSEPMVSSLNNDEIDFRISFDESDLDDLHSFNTAYLRLIRDGICEKSHVSIPSYGCVCVVFVALLEYCGKSREMEGIKKIYLDRIACNFFGDHGDLLGGGGGEFSEVAAGVMVEEKCDVF